MITYSPRASSLGPTLGMRRPSKAWAILWFTLLTAPQASCTGHEPICRNGVDCSWTAVSTEIHGGCLVRADGTAWCWGLNASGQIGDGTTKDRDKPVRVLDIQDVAAVAVGLQHRCALLISGSIACWGNNEDGQVGDGTLENRERPVDIYTPADVIKVSAFRARTVVLLADGTVWRWGAGIGTIPVQMTEIDDVADVSGRGTCAAKIDGTVWWWQYGEPPVQIPNLTSVVEVAEGEYFACALTADEEVWCWGDNESGELGDGTTVDASEPVRVVDLDEVQSISSGAFHTCAIIGDGTAWCWGFGGHGVLGNRDVNMFGGPYYVQSTPVQVDKLTDVVQIHAGWDTTCAITADGKAWGWGSLMTRELTLHVDDRDIHHDGGTEYIAVPFPLLDP